jgi:hypothetical protein
VWSAQRSNQHSRRSCISIAHAIGQGGRESRQAVTAGKRRATRAQKEAQCRQRRCANTQARTTTHQLTRSATLAPAQHYDWRWWRGYDRSGGGRSGWRWRRGGGDGIFFSLRLWLQFGGFLLRVRGERQAAAKPNGTVGRIGIETLCVDWQANLRRWLRSACSADCASCSAAAQLVG